jgi:hypothetical protein
VAEGEDKAKQEAEQAERAFRIEHPTPGLEIGSLSFSAYGSAPRGLRLFGSLVGPNGVIVPGETIRPPSSHNRWMIAFINVPFEPEDEFTLQIRKNRVDGPVVAEIEGLKVFPRVAVGISWPPNNHSQCNTRVAMYGHISDPDTAIVRCNWEVRIPRSCTAIC